MRKSLIAAVAVLLFVSCGQKAQETNVPEKTKARVVALTDAEIDDQCSMVRFMLSLNEYDLEGIITTSSQFHWHGYSWAGDDWLDPYLDAYEEVYPNLILHDPSFPTPEYVRGVSKLGNCEAEGEMDEVTPGSEFIANLLLDEDDDRPIWFQAWGGTGTLARALKTIEEEHPEKMDYVASKIKLFLIWEQDDTYDKYIRPSWGEYNMLTVNSDQFNAFAYIARRVQPEENQEYFSGEWIKSNIVEDHGPLCALYHTGWGGGFLSEGDSPSFMHMQDVGLRNEEHPDWGGWAGRYIWVRENTWMDSVPSSVTDYEYPERRYFRDNVWNAMAPEVTPEQRAEYYHDITMWSAAVQNDMAARADWCVMDYEEANHAPVPAVKGELDIEAAAGKKVKLDASPSTDPDGDALGFFWWEYTQADSYEGEIAIADPTAASTSFIVPSDAKPGDTIHVVCSIADAGTPALTRYVRIVVTVK